MRAAAGRESGDGGVRGSVGSRTRGRQRPARREDGPPKRVVRRETHGSPVSRVEWPQAVWRSSSSSRSKTVVGSLPFERARSASFDDHAGSRRDVGARLERFGWQRSVLRIVVTRFGEGVWQHPPCLRRTAWSELEGTCGPRDMTPGRGGISSDSGVEQRARWSNQTPRLALGLRAQAPVRSNAAACGSDALGVAGARARGRRLDEGVLDRACASF